MNYNTIFMKLSSDSKAFLELITVKRQPNPEVLHLAVARALANNAVLPGSEIEDPIAFYRNTCRLSIEDNLAQLNEAIVLDTTRVKKLTEDFYMARYYAAYPLKAIYSFKQELAVPSFFGFGAFVSIETLELINANSVEIVNIYNNITRICKEINIIKQAANTETRGLVAYGAE